MSYLKRIFGNSKKPKSKPKQLSPSQPTERKEPNVNVTQERGNEQIKGFNEVLAGIPNGPVLYTHDRDRAFQWYSQKGFPQHDHNEELWTGWYKGMAQRADKSGIFDESWAACHHALAGYLSKDTPNIQTICWLCWYLGRAQTARGEYGLALLYLDAMQRLSDPKDVNVFGSSLTEKAVLANIAQQPDEYKAALESLTEYFMLPSGPGASVGTNVAHLVFKDGYTNHEWISEGKPIKSHLILATGYYQLSLDMNRKLGNKQGIALSLANLGDVWRKLGDKERALVCWRESLTYLSEIGDQTTAGDVRKWMGEL